MKHSNKYQSFSFLNLAVQVCTFIILFTGCAQVVRPTGGQADIKAPEILRYLPENKTLQFNGQTFSIEFNEFFVVKDPNKQWIISPPLKQTPDYKIRGKLLTVTFDDTLKENTTYNFNFGKSIADVNEGNELIGLSYIFSTGSFIDSLQLTGKVSQAFNNANEKDVLIMLYEERRCKEDSFPFKKLPDYFAISDALGNYKLNYIKPGNYYAIALKDANSNYLFDNFEEAIGMYDSVIHLQSNKNIDFKIFKEIEEKSYLKNKLNGEYGSFTLVFNKRLPSLELLPLHTTKQKDWAYIEMSKAKDTVNIWLKDFSIDTLKLALKNNQITFDTIEMAVLPKEKFSNKNKRLTNARVAINISPVNGAEKDLNSPLLLTSNHPIDAINQDSILILEGNKKMAYRLVKRDSLGRKLQLDCEFKNDSSYSLTIFPGAFKDCFGYKNDTIISKFKVPSIESVGNLYLTIKADSTAKIIDFTKENILLQLLNEKGDIVKTQVLNNYGTINYLNFKPGSYKAQIVIDSNNNNEWDTGNFIKKKQAERIIFMNAPMNLRANWDLEEAWKLNLTAQ